ncbi:TraI/MobA(P) family conjugative relaxase [Thalassospira profundimaris]|uniref:TraI/MobA(P) family conjugative relaxase n=1 Tax=Thalassospira profundimaris TaxID=502049 RepID=UPI000DED8AB9|nr:TraI/MobA(P) family conjugative relaxase [Thalassospira profundimaris]
MIAKKIPKNAHIADNYKELAHYIAAAKEAGEKLDRFWIANCGAGESKEDLDLALVEIEAVRRLKPDVKDKSYHMIVSFRPGEKDRLSDQDLKDIAETYAGALGFGGHQYVAGTHINTDNFHMHIAFNRVHPETLQLVTPYRDFKILDRVSRQLEKKYGLFVDNGMAQRKDNSAKLSPSARDYESQTWQESFQTHVLGHRDAILKQTTEAKNWPELHDVLAEYDIRIKKRGNGFVLLGPDGQGMKASALDRSMSKAALEKKLGQFKPPIAEQKATQAKPLRPKRRYKRRPILRHPAMPPLWRKYLGTQKLTPAPPSSLVSRSLSNWKLFLVSEAYRDPLAAVFLIAHQEMLHLVFGEDHPTPVTKLANPALKAWQEAGHWAKAKSLSWLSETRSTGRGCRMDDEGNLLVPFRDRNGHLQAVRLYSPEGKSLNIGNERARGLVHLIDTRKQIDKGPVIFTADYADAVKIHDATRRPVMVLADPNDMRQVLKEHQRRYPDSNAIIADPAIPRQPNVPIVSLPDQDDATDIRRAFAQTTDDKAFMVWDTCTDWANSKNSAWLKATGLRGYGVKLTDKGNIAVPLRDRFGRIENVMLIDKQGRQSLVQDTPSDQMLTHRIDPQRRGDQDTLIIARDYADAAALHRATNCPVMTPARPEDWADLARQMCEKNNNAEIIVALGATEQPDDAEKATRLGMEIVRPKMATSFKDYAAPHDGNKASRLIASGTAHYKFDPEKSESSFVTLQDANGIERTLWGIDIAQSVDQADAKPGDWITLEVAETKEVEVEEEYRDETGHIQTRTIKTHRNVWKTQIKDDPAKTPTMTALRTELAPTVGDDALQAWQASKPADKQTIKARPELGTAKAWAQYRVDKDGKVLIPLRDGGNRLVALYQVDADGSGEMSTGPGSDNGLHHVVGGKLPKNPKEPILIADDLVSALELNRLTEKPVVWTVTTENLKAVAETVRRFNPKHEIVIAASDAYPEEISKPLKQKPQRTYRNR